MPHESPLAEGGESGVFMCQLCLDSTLRGCGSLCCNSLLVGIVHCIWEIFIVLSPFQLLD